MIWHSLPASWCCRWWTFTGSWGELGWGTRENHETSQNIVKSWRNQSLQRYHMISWYILKHHETSWHLFQYSLFFDYSGMSLQSTYIWRRAETRGKWGSDISWYVLKHHETSWTLFQYSLFFWFFRDVTTINLHLEMGDGWKVRVRYIMIYHDISQNIMRYIMI